MEAKLRSSKTTLLAQELGISRRRVKLLGGADKLQALDADALATLIRPAQYGNSKAVIKGGLATKGFRFWSANASLAEDQRKWHYKYDRLYRVPVKGWTLT